MHSRVLSKVYWEDILKPFQKFSFLHSIVKHVNALPADTTLKFCKRSDRGFFFLWVVCVFWLPPRALCYTMCACVTCGRKKLFLKALGLQPNLIISLKPCQNSSGQMIFKKLVGMYLHAAPVTRDSQRGIRQGKKKSVIQC